MTTQSAIAENKKATRWLEVLSFCMADVQAGLGPFLGVFLQKAGWATSAIGTIMTIGGLAGVAAATPGGALIDRTNSKRAYVVVAGTFSVIASLLPWFSQNFWVVAASQVATAIAGAALAPALTGLTLGIARKAGFNRQFGKNQAYNHGGNVAAAILSGWLGWQFGFGAVFAIACVFGVLTIVSALMIPAAAIDNEAARGAEDDEGKAEDVKGFRILLTCKPLLILAAALCLFHLGNAAMLSLYGLAIVKAGEGDPAAFTAATIVVAQGVMIVCALIASRLAEKRGYWLVLLLTFIALPLRGVVAAFFVKDWGVFPVQMLDGIGAGLQSVAVPGLVAKLLDGTGRMNIGQGAVMTVQGIGAAISPVIGGMLAQYYGFPVAFLTLGAFSIGSIVLWLLYAPLLKEACGSCNRDPA